MAHKLDLPDVTLICIDQNPRMGLRALRKSLEHICPQKAILITGGAQVTAELREKNTDMDVFYLPPTLSWPNWYCQFILTMLHAYFTTKFCLKVEWDGYVTNALAWAPEFLDYDYVGAAWEWHPQHRQVGNGGFSLRSKRLCEFTAGLTYTAPIKLDDEFICQELRGFGERYFDMRFAPVDVAHRFSYERSGYATTFGFHGFFNFWQHHSHTEMIDFVNEMPDYLVIKPEYNELIEHYRDAMTADVFHALVNRKKKALVCPA